MTVSAPPITNAEAAQHIARALGPVLPLCYARAGVCGCSGRYDRDLGKLVPHEGHDIAKAPISKLVRNGLLDATQNSATIDRHWRQEPDAGVGLDLEAAGLIFIDPDSPDALAEAEREGIEGGMRRDSRNVGWFFKRPKDCPAVSITKSADGTDLEVRATGYAVVHNTHQNGDLVRLDLSTPLRAAPSWAVERLKAKAVAAKAQEAATAARRAERASQYGNGPEPPVRLHQRGQRRWCGELVEMKNGKVDRDLSLWYIGLDLAECGASEAAIVAALEERDATLGWEKFTNRKDDREYVKIAEKVVASAIEKERAPRLQFTATAAVPDDVAALRAAIEERDAEIMRLQRRALDQDDRLEILEDIIHSIDDVLNRPNEEMSASDKVGLIATARWLPFFRSKQEANGKPTSIALGYVAKVAGTSKSTLSSLFVRFSSDDPEAGAPFRRRVTRRLKFDENGSPVIDPRTGRQAFESELELMPWGERPSETLRAAVRYAAVHPRAKHGGSQEAADARWGRCDKHDNREVRIKGYCPECGKVVGEKIVRLAEFSALNEQVAHSDTGAPHGVDGYLIGEQVAHSDAQPVSLFDYAASRRPDPPPERCPAPGCRSMEFKRQSDGSWRCLKSGHDPSAYQVVPAVAGGSGWEMKRDPDLPPADVDVTGYRACCRTHGVIRGRGGHWTCADCGEPIAAVVGGSE